MIYFERLPDVAFSGLRPSDLWNPTPRSAQDARGRRGAHHGAHLLLPHQHADEEAVADPDRSEDPRKSTELSKLQSSHQLGADTLQLLWSDPARNAALQQLLQLGFEESASKNALQSAAFDAEHAAELLLMAGAADDLGLQERMGSSSSCQPNRWGKKLAKAAKAQAAFIPTEAQLNSPVYPFFIFFFSGSPRVWERDWKNFT